MSSHRLSVSGDRQYTLTAGGGAYSSVQYPSKQGTDAATVTFSAAGEIAAVLPQGAVIEKVRAERKMRGDETYVSEFLVLRIKGQPNPNPDYAPGMVALTLDLTPHEHGLLHTNVDVRKHDPEQPSSAERAYGLLEVLETIELRSDPTEPVDKLDAADRLLTNIEAGTSDVEQAIAAARSAIDSARGKLLRTDSSGDVGRVEAGGEFPTIESGEASESA